MNAKERRKMLTALYPVLLHETDLWAGGASLTPSELIRRARTLEQQLETARSVLQAVLCAEPHPHYGDDGVHDEVVARAWAALGTLIAAAPDLLARLCDEIERLRALAATWTEEADFRCSRASNPEVVGLIEREIEVAAALAFERCANEVTRG